MVKYNIALVPLTKNEEFIGCANQFAKIADKYLLGEKSLPHVTLYQLDIDEKEVQEAWQRVIKNWHEAPIKLEFKEFSCLSFDDGITFWPSLLPDNCKKLHGMHCLIAKILDKSIKTDFDPHMTLLSTKNHDRKIDMELLNASYKPISDKFILSFGCTDEVGQLTKIAFFLQN